MGRGHKPLLAELHAHTTWSDGVLTPGELVDLHGRAGFDVLAITDHVVRSEFACHVRAETYRDYLATIDAEAERARKQYGMLVLPGLELTVESRDPGRAGHAVAVGLREFVSVDGGLEAALCDARDLGAALIAVHPYPLESASESIRGTAWFAENPDRAAEVVDRFELFNRNERFHWVAEQELPFVATGDFHVPEHLFTWKTLLTCECTEGAVVERLRSSAPCALMRITAGRIAA
jgi:predicted metal-dependent phosphoesterase TrpH